MAIHPATLTEIRSWVGEASPADSDLEARYARLESVHLVALEVLRGRLADLLADPLKYSVQNDASWDYGDNVKYLSERIGELEVLAGVSGAAHVVTVGSLTRSRRWR